MICLLKIGRWSSKFGDFPAGDPELHHVAGTLYAESTAQLFASLKAIH